MNHDDEIQAAAAVHNWSAAWVIENIDAVEPNDSRFVAWCRTVKEELVPDLLRIMRAQTGPARLQASLLLLHLGKAEGTDGIIGCLAEDDLRFRNAVLLQLTFLPHAHRNSPAPLAIKKAALFAAIKPYLELDDHAEADRQRAYTQELAVRLVFLLEIPAGRSQIQTLLQRGPLKVRATIIGLLARQGEDEGAIAAAEALLDHEPHVHFVIGALESYCKGNDAEAAQRAAQLLVSFVRKHFRQPGNYATNHLWHAMDGIVAANHPQQKQILELVLKGPVKDGRRGIALRHLAPLDADRGSKRLRHALRDPALRQYAAEGIARMGPTAPQAELAPALLAAAQQEEREQVLTKLITALVAVGTDMTTLPEEIRARLDPHSAMWVHWLANKITPQAAADLLQREGIITPPSAQKLGELAERWHNNEAAAWIVHELLSDRLAWFDTETSEVPPNYLDLMAQLMAITGPEFPATDFSQTPVAERDSSLVQFSCAGQTHSFLAQDYGDYYDVGAVLDGLNGALQQLNKSERFILLYTGDQTAQVLFAPEPAFRRAAEALGIVRQTDADASRQQGIAYEQVVWQTIRDDPHFAPQSAWARLWRRWVALVGRRRR